MMVAGLEIRRIRPEELPAAFALLAANGWRERLGDQTRFSALLDVSQVALVAVAGGQVVGFMRGITDGLSNGYLSMLVVAAEHRGQGVGRHLVEHAVGCDDGVTWVLRAGREGAAGFFAKLGFEVSTLAMERRRTRASEG